MASSDSEMAVLADYKSSLNDLDCNSKPMINVLTMLAEENQSFARGIVKIIKERILESTMKIKLPSLYLLDSILKNVGGDFIEIISLSMIEIFTNVFEKGDEKIRMSLFKLRYTWPQYFPTAFLHQLDLVVRELDPNWPVVEIPPSSGSIHINPKFLVKEHNSSEVSENISARDPLKLRVQKKQLLAEEQRIQDQLRILKAEQQRIVASKEEEERISREWILKQKQLEREQMIREQQKQIMALRKIQEEQETTFHKTVKRTGQIMEQPQLHLRTKQSDPRLPKEESKYENLRTHTSEVKAENIEFIENTDIPERNQLRVVDQGRSIETHEEEPVAKKRKSNDELQKLPNEEQKLSSRDKSFKETEYSEKGKKENVDSITDIPCQKDEISVSVGEKIKVKEAISSSENENDSKVKHGIISEVIHDETRYTPLEKADSNKRLRELPATVESGNSPIVAIAVPCVDRTHEVSLTANSVTEPNDEPVALDSKNDGSILSSGRGSDSDEIKRALATSESSETSEVMGVPFKTEKGKPGGGFGSEMNEEREFGGGFDSTKAFDEKFGHQPVDKTDFTSRDAPTQKTHHKEMRVEMPRPLPRSIEGRSDRSEFVRNEKQISSRQRHPRGRGILFRGRGNRRTPPLDSAQLPKPNEHVTDKRLKRPPWRRPMEQPDIRRPPRPYRAMENDEENERLPRGNRRIDFYARRPRFKGHLSGSSASLSRRMGRHGFNDERQESRETFDPPQRSENRHTDEFMYRNQRFEEPRNFRLDNEKYYRESDFYDPRTNQMERRERLRFPEGNVGEFQPEVRTFNRDYNRMQFRNENDLPPLREEDSMPRNSMRFSSNERFLRNDEDHRPYDERNIAQGPEHLDNRFTVRSGELSRRSHSYMPRYVEDEDRFVKAYQGSAEKQFKDHLPPDNLESTMNHREGQNSYDFDRFTGKTESSFLQAGNAGGDHEAIRSGIADKSTTRSTNSNSLVEMIMNITQSSESLSKKEEASTDADSTQSQRQEASTDIKKLFEGLVSAGVLQGSMFTNEPTASPPPNIETSEDDIPSIGFVMEQLKTRHDSVINKLYCGAQCGTCGLRFTQDDKKFYRDHLDWHFRNNRIGRDGKRSASRAWYHFKEVWMDMDDVTDFEEQAKSAVFELERTLQNPVDSENNQSCSVLRGDEVCNICCEPFEQFWDESHEEWRYNDAIRIDGMAYHVNCYDDVKTGHSSDQDVSVDEMGSGLTMDPFGKDKEDLSPTPVELNPKPFPIDQMNVLPSDVDKQEIIKISQNGNLQGQNIANDSTEYSRENTPEPSKELCSKFSDELKGKDDNEIT